MKILLITLSMFVLLTIFSFTLDLTQGFEPRTAYLNAMSPFKVMELIESFVFVILIALFFLQSVLQVFTKKRSPK
ncbi:hypothetical protein QUF79_24985 [Fictibacillus enclensis]|uniref:hypothetical protein n=1 Tax=Fictibacillus enclensis TaxID=1017270 RepID=UPI0024C09BFE|nr:hypothetical protein [Fictibacillus enclensis]MDM5201285.1 hypothetical protein [Fictibacillus enclensis]WHY72124.1 hypothetical protein QNH15_24570 [Fictibacillus enclensis]